ncbi:MAG TPA: hypothetical protein VFO10_23400 [Oligoflexus sp.]|uniref:hypothetical protein n=1 Tax=Oligoflexus sp. TaxID=1971216 RepID=UPI002D7FA30A|nr:hypothetical protein [Oligoflexus sp.]HET9240229.1 hypothetical protein [Oligoflexus sp.]
MSWKNNVLKAVCLAALMSCDGATESGSELKREATPESPTSNLVRVRDGSRIDFVMVSNNRGYKLACDNPLKLNRLIEATGYPANLISTTQVLEMDSQAYLDLAPNEQPVLSCVSDKKVLYRANIDQTTKYFFSDPVKGKTRLYMFGCQALVDAMGFQLANATELSANFIDDLNIFSVANDDDISCISGVPVGAGVKWKSGANTEKLVAQGTDIGFTSFEALLPNGTTAPLTITKEVGRCDWIQKIFLGSGLLVTGKSPDDFYNQSCELTITAAAKTPLETSLKFNAATAKVQPVVTTDCSLNRKYSKPSEFNPCSVTADKGTVTLTVKPEANCQDVFKFDASTRKLSLSDLPLLGVSCHAEFSAELSGVVSEPKTVTVERVCALGTKPNATGTCEVVACDSEHRYQDSWTVPSDESKGYRLMYCPATGIAEDRGLGSCFAGYEKRMDQCRKACASDFLEGDVRTSGIANGSLTEICKNGDISSIRTCNANALLRDNVCLLTCDKVHVDGNSWDVGITNGTQKNSCVGTTLTAGPITCSSGYLLRAGSCKIACDSQHVEGDTWSEPIGYGNRDNLCNGQGQIVSSVSCIAGYEFKEGACKANLPPPPKNCGTRLHDTTWTITDCGTGGEYRVRQRCDNGNVVVVSSTKIGNICR